MLRIIRFRLISILEDYKAIMLFVLMFVLINYNIFANSGLLSRGMANFNKESKYALLINNFNISIFLLGALLAIYIGTGLIGKDIKTGQIYIILAAYPNRTLYLLSNYIALVMVLLTEIIIALINLYSIYFVLDIYVNHYEVMYCFLQSLLNLIVIMTVTATFSIVIKGIGSFISSVVFLCIYNVYSSSMIPIINQRVFISDEIKRILYMIAPLTKPAPPSLVDLEYSSTHNTLPYIFISQEAYQILFCMILVISGIYIFKNKEL